MTKRIQKSVRGKRKLVISKCPHTDRPYYSKGMCVNCYGVYGRTKQATQCPHPDRLMYAKGKCLSCYRFSQKMSKLQ